MPAASYRFFDTAVTIDTDSPGFLERFDASYGSFRSEEAGEDVFRVQLDGSPRLTIGGREVAGGDPASLSIYALNAVLNRISDNVTSHLLIHGAALAAPAGRGVIIAGRSGLGKTTLAVELLGRGFGFLSDEIAAVNRQSLLLDPFPRRIGRRVQGMPRGEKEVFEFGDPAPPAKPGFLFMLHNPADARQKSSCYVVVDRSPAGLRRALLEIPGVREAILLEGTSYPSFYLDLSGASLAAVEPAIAAVCERHGALLLEVVRGSGTAPDFSGEPGCELLGTAEAARSLLGHLRCSPRSRMVAEVCGGSASRLLLVLSDLCEGMACYRLTVGRLDRMVDIIRETSAAT
jgi:hypothetical protein